MYSRGNYLITIQCFPSTYAGPLSSVPSVPLASPEAKDSHSFYLREEAYGSPG